ncbi:PREDICTED: squamosa promoter-binding-like protein 14 [Tarenaya hassleriana]|uniref:squamosa promoter-binding-like protein 14 n=1 Tax=Tarenaya hassleriana TaxID=28532 RepID=UPI00053C7561|nr:PREDICTED: squamosa promoter-binding-like protein 14 [Tarenaya hassleriana]
MDEVGAQVAAPVFVHQSLTPMGRKRDLYFQIPNLHTHRLPQTQTLQRGDDWNPKMWDWDSRRFEAKPVETEVLRLGNDSQFDVSAKSNNNNSGLTLMNSGCGGSEVDERNLDLNLGSGLTGMEETQANRQNKRVRSGSPGGGNYPMCQVDFCKEDLSNAKDYHRRHKVCKLHSKASKALVGKQMQRFCQQCSRFHLLSEFDEGKRSCRRRLAGHNRRRRKTQPEEITSRVVVPGNRDPNSNPNTDLVALLTALACAQGRNEVKPIESTVVPDRERLLQILNKINSLPLPMDLASKLNNIGVLARKNLDHSVDNFRNDMNGTSQSTMDLLAVLSSTLASSSHDALALMSQMPVEISDSDKTKLTPSDQGTTADFEKRTRDFGSVGGEKSSSSHQSPSQDSDSHFQDTRSSLSLQLFTSSPEDESRPTVATSRKYYSSASSNPVEDRSLSSSPVMQELFPKQASPETTRSKKDKNTGFRTGCLPLELFGASNRGAENNIFKGFGHQAGYASSGSDNSPPSLNSDAQDRTGRIVFKLLGKDPSQLPGTLRTQIYNWLSNIPSEMESYIRPGCVILSVYVAMSSAAWEQLEENLQERVGFLLQDSCSEFWRRTRFLVNTGRQLASYKDGKIRLSKSWRTWNSPELISVSPVAVVAGEETTLLVRGRNLDNGEIRIRCAHMGSYASMEVTTSSCKKPVFDELNVSSFRINGGSHGFFGRCFIEVENGFRGDSFPLIIADAAICKELNRLEDEFHPKTQVHRDITEERLHNSDRPSSREEVLCFLNELGWLFQRNASSFDIQGGSDFSMTRFKFLLVFSVERDYCSLVRKLLDMVVERNSGKDGLIRESRDMLAEIQLLNRAVKRRSTKMAKMLIHYSVTASSLSTSKEFVFLPDTAGPGGITPLHLAASTSGSDGMIDVLTNDPQEIGLSCWNSLLDKSGHTPYSYASTRNNHRYNALVARKLTDKRNRQVSINIESRIDGQTGLSNRSSSELKRSSCTTCGTVALKYQRKISGSYRLFPTPIIHSMLAVATVCVCVCVFMHAFPIVRQGAHFSWGGLDYGSM